MHKHDNNFDKFKLKQEFAVYGKLHLSVRLYIDCVILFHPLTLQCTLSYFSVCYSYHFLSIAFYKLDPLPNSNSCLE